MTRETDRHTGDKTVKTGPNEPKRRFWWFRIPIYVRIFEGMVVGLVVGLLFGPQSPLLDADRARVTRKGGVALCAQPDASEKTRAGGAKNRLKTFAELEILEKKEVEGTLWFRVKPVPQAGEGGDGAEKRGAVQGWLPETDLSSPYSSVGETVVSYLRPVGKVFLRLIKMLVVPLVFVSLLVGVFSLSDMKKLGRLGGKTLLYYAATTAVAILIGLTLANLVKPGRHVTEKQRDSLVAGYEGEAAKKREVVQGKKTGVVHRLVHMIPTNPIQAAAEGDMLQIIFFALFFGIILRRVGGKGPERLVGIFETVNQALVKAVVVVMETAPFGVLALLADVVGTSGLSVLLSLGVYCLVVLTGLVLHLFLTYGLALKVLTKVGLRRFLKAARPAQLMGFSTSSSAATLPVTFKCAGETLGISKPVTSFVLPLGATVNMDGTALYQAVAAVFVAQVFGLPLDLEAQVAVLLTALLASVGAAAVPGAGIIMLAMVLEAAGLPDAGIALVLGVDRLLDMFRTALNVTGDLSAAAIVAVSEGETLNDSS